MKTVSAVAAIVLCCILAVKGATLDLTLSLQAFVQGIVEGVTEFLPVSSTGHMIIVDRFFPMKDEAFAKLFEVVIQLGAILSVLVYFYRTIFPRKWNIEGFKAMIPLWSRVVVGVIPAAVIGFLLDDFIEAHLFNIVVVSVALVVWGVALVFSGRLEKRESSTPEIVKMSYGKALAVGFFQRLEKPFAHRPQEEETNDQHRNLAHRGDQQDPVGSQQFAALVDHGDIRVVPDLVNAVTVGKFRPADRFG